MHLQTPPSLPPLLQKFLLAFFAFTEGSVGTLCVCFFVTNQNSLSRQETGVPATNAEKLKAYGNGVCFPALCVCACVWNVAVVVWFLLLNLKARSLTARAPH